MKRDLKQAILDALWRDNGGHGLMVEAIALQHVRPQTVEEQAGHGKRVRLALTELLASGVVTHRSDLWRIA